MRIKRNRKNIAFVLAVVLLCTVFVGAAIAENAIGDVTVTAPQLTLMNLATPATVNPTETFTISADLIDVDSVTLMTSLMLDVWHSSSSKATHALDADPAVRYTGRVFKTGVIDPVDTRPIGWIISTTDLTGMAGVKTVRFEIEVQLQAVALEGTWSVDMTVFEGTVTSTVVGSFVVNQFLALTLAESTFSWSEVQQGMIDIAIVNPTSGYLSIQVVSNYDTKLQVKGTDPTFGVNSFPVSNIKVHDADVLISAVPLTSDFADLNLVTYLGTNIVHLYLWISVPVGAALGTYTMTLSIILIAG